MMLPCDTIYPKTNLLLLLMCLLLKAAETYIYIYIFSIHMQLQYLSMLMHNHFVAQTKIGYMLVSHTSMIQDTQL